LEAERTVEAETRLENLNEFLGLAREYDEKSSDQSLAGFLEQLALVAEIDNYRAKENAVVLMTLHSAKGLEFPVVFLTGLEEGLFPHAHALGEEEELEEERRLCYVGITRARERLFFSWACRRYLQGGSAVREPSRFLEEAPQELLYPVLPGRGEAFPARPAPAWDQPAQNGREKLPPVFTGRALLEAAAGGNQAAAEDQEAGFNEPQGDLKAGDRVEHKKFGLGIVTETRVGPGGDLEIFVTFEKVGAKHLLVKYAPLRRL
jgi:DNA helicase-2/ATP-dependent DNA helicase PcrA